MLSVFTKINEKLNEGWKLTNMNCPICNTTVLGNLQTKEFRCVKCDMPVKLELEEEEKEEEPVFEIIESKKPSPSDETDNFNREEFDNMLYSKEREEKRKRDQENSKKLGELLLSGWTMLADGCENCLQPLMKSKKGEIRCVGCGPVVDKQKEATKEIEKIEEKTVAPTLEKAKTSEQKPPVVQPKEETRVSSPEKSVKKPSESFERIENHEPQVTRIASSQLFELMQFDQSISFYSKLTNILGEELEKVRRGGFENNINKLENILEFQRKIDENKINILNQFTGSKK